MNYYPLNQTCFDLMINQMKQLGLGTDSNSLHAMAYMIRVVADSMTQLDTDETYRINGFNVKRRVTGEVFETDTLYFNDKPVFQLQESYEGKFTTFVNVGAIISDTVINSLLYLAG